jgi:hypothetical protein
MNLIQEILKEIQDLPDNQQREVLDFTRFIKYKLLEISTIKRETLFGSDRNEIYLAENFDEPLNDFDEYM